MRPLLSVVAITLLASSLAAAPAGAETRYTPPPATVLSGDLASPWLLQLKNREQYQKRMQRNQQALLRWQAQEQKRQTARVAFRPKPAQPSPQPQTARSKQANDPNRLDPQFLPQRVEYASGERPGTIIIDTERRKVIKSVPVGRVPYMVLIDD